MKTLSFELTMPNVGSWNGKWTGAENKYFIIRKVDNNTFAKIMKEAKSVPLYEGFFTKKLIGYSSPRENFYYNFGDGWGANIRVEQVNASEARKRKKNSKGFCGYEWMVNSIIQFGEILNEKQRNELNES